MKFPVFDLHCDTATERLCHGTGDLPSLRSNSGHISLERAKKLDGYAQCFAFFTFPGQVEYTKMSVPAFFDLALSRFLEELSANSDLILQSFSSAEVRANYGRGKMSAILTLEGTAGINFDPARLEGLWAQGFRISTMTWNEKNPLAGSHRTGGGLTDQGRAYVREAQRLGMLIDVSHLSDEAFWDLMQVTCAPIIASHSNSRAVWGSSRNLTDDMFRAICETGGVAGLNLYTDFIGAEPVSLHDACKHIVHFLELDPEGKHISLGGDLDGCETLPAGFDGVDCYCAFAEELLKAGVGETLVHRIFWDNALEVMERCCM